MFGAMRQAAIRGLNHLIQSESWAQERLRHHTGAGLLVEAGGLTIRLTIDEHGLFHSGDSSTPPDVTLSLPTDAAFGMLFDREKAFGAVKLGGSAEIAECLAFVFRNLRWDVEADLAAIVGDISARRLSMIGHSTAIGLQKGIVRAAENVREYAVEDSGLLAKQSEVIAFGVAVNDLRDALTHLEERIARL